jgi:uncharacterized protein YegJ (DUF2314 family)
MKKGRIFRPFFCLEACLQYSYRFTGIVAATVFALSSGLLAQDKTINVPNTDPVMNAAIEKARSTLPKFWVRLAKREQGDDYFAIKLRLTEGENTEHIWCDSVTGDETAATCAIGNDPQLITTVKAGERVPIDPVSISDWMIRSNGKIVGGQTIRALLPQMDKAQADNLRAVLADE